MKNSMCALLATPPNLVIVYTAVKPRHRRTLTIVIESVGKIFFWEKKNTNSYLKRHLVTYTEGVATMNINTSAKHVFNFMPKYK